MIDVETHTKNLYRREWRFGGWTGTTSRSR